MKKFVFMFLIIVSLMISSCKGLDSYKVDMPSTKEVSFTLQHEGEDYHVSYRDKETEKSVDLKVIFKNKEYRCQFFYTAENPDVVGMLVDINTTEKTGAVGFKYKNASGTCGIQNIIESIIEDSKEEPKEEIPVEEPKEETKVTEEK